MNHPRPARRPRAPRALLAAALLALAACGVPGTIASSGRLPPAAASAVTPALPPIRFPADEAPHRDLTEWWYYTGHLSARDASGRQRVYGFELVFFQTLRGRLPPYYAAHFAITDVTGGQFSYDQRAGFEPPSVIPPAGAATGFQIALGGWSVRGLNGRDQLAAAMPSFAIDLRLTGLKPAVLHNGNGLISYGAAGFSYYYSRPRMAVTGTLTARGVPLAVTGQAWMDHQWGNFVSIAGAGWDWFSIQLDNGTDYMLYVIRDQRQRSVSVVGTRVAADGTATPIPAASIQTRALGTWTSPRTGGVYPSGWRVALPLDGVTLTLTPQLRDQELVTGASTGVAYWEGAVAIAGSVGGQAVTGVGYVELTGYATVPSTAAGATVP